MSSKGGIIGGIITLVIGSAVYTVNQTDIVNNFSKDTGLSKQESQKYVESVTEDDMVPFDEFGSELISSGQDLVNVASQIDCVNYQYEWETKSLPCEKGKLQLNKLGNSQIELGKAYRVLASESASTNDISRVISLIDRLNVDLNQEIVSQMLDYPTIDEWRKSNSFNKAMLKTALDSN